MTARDDYQRAAMALAAVERKIDNLTRWGRPSPESISGRVLASLEAKRDRETPAVIALKCAADKDASTARHVSSDIRFKRFEPVPIGTLAIDDGGLPDIPACLRRIPTLTE